MVSMARKHKNTPLVLLDKFQKDRLREQMLRLYWSAAVVDACFEIATERTATGVVVERWILREVPKADTANCRPRECARCGRLTPAVYLVRYNGVEICQDCATGERAASSPFHEFMEVLRQMNIRLRW